MSEKSKSQINPYTCETCKKPFRRQDQLIRHGKRKFPCKQKNKPTEEEEKTIKYKVEDVLNNNINIIDDIPKNDNLITFDIRKQYPLTPFQLDLDYSTGNIIGIVASSRSGKSFALSKIFKDFFECRNLISTLYANNLNAKIYKDFGNKKYLIKTFEFYPEIVELQHKIQKRTKSKYNFLNMLEDQLADKNDITLTRMVNTYRNSKMSAIITQQYPRFFSKANRNSLNYIMFGNLNSDETIKDTIKDFLNVLFNGMKLTIEQKVEIYRELTKNYSFILMNMMTNEVSFHRL